MQCSEALDLLYSSFDAQITPMELAQLNGHRRTCFACANSLIKAEQFQQLLRHVPQLTVPRGLEERIINRVAIKSGAISPSRAKVISFAAVAKTHWKGFAGFAGAMAAAFAAVIVAHNALLNQPATVQGADMITAFVQGSVQDVGQNSEVKSLSSQSQISTGDTLRNDAEAPATVAISPHLAVTNGGDSQIHFNRLHLNSQTGKPDVVDVHVDRGTLRVRETLHREVSPIHVATNQATMVPTGTAFTVTSSESITRLKVTQGSVAVYIPGRVFSVKAGQGVRIYKSMVVHDSQPKHPKPSVKIKA